MSKALGIPACKLTSEDVQNLRQNILDSKKKKKNEENGFEKKVKWYVRFKKLLRSRVTTTFEEDTSSAQQKTFSFLVFYDTLKIILLIVLKFCYELQSFLYYKFFFFYELIFWTIIFLPSRVIPTVSHTLSYIVWFQWKLMFFKYILFTSLTSFYNSRAIF